MADRVLPEEGGAGRQTLDVVIATNRRSEFLPETLASVEAQVGVDCNVVIVDDGTPDPAYVRACAAKVARATVIRQAPAGPSAARNRGLHECSGPFLAFLDDDDVWEPLKSLKQITTLQTNQGAVACACSGWYIDSAGVRGESWAPAGNHDTQAYLDGRAPLPRIVTLVFTRSVCEAVGGFDESFRYGEDLEFTWRVLLSGPCVAVPEKLVGYRQHHRNTSRGDPFQSRDQVDRALRKLIRLCDEDGDHEAASAFRRRLGEHRSGSRMESLRRLRAAFRTGAMSEASHEAAWLLRRADWWVPGVGCRPYSAHADATGDAT